MASKCFLFSLSYVFYNIVNLNITLFFSLSQFETQSEQSSILHLCLVHVKVTTTSTRLYQKQSAVTSLCLVSTVSITTFNDLIIDHQIDVCVITGPRRNSQLDINGPCPRGWSHWCETSVSFTLHLTT